MMIMNIEHSADEHHERAARELLAKDEIKHSMRLNCDNKKSARKEEQALVSITRLLGVPIVGHQHKNKLKLCLHTTVITKSSY